MPKPVWAAVCQSMRLIAVPRSGSEYVYRTYGTARRFETEGDLYESITGRRSTVIK